MAPFVLFRDDLAGRSVLFDAPERVIVADDADEFAPALEALEAAKQAGKWLAGYFSYEAGYLFEPKLAPLLPRERRAPLLCFGVFDGPAGNGPDLPGDGQPGEPVMDARADWDFARYAPAFERIHRHLREGDCYQANLTFPVRARWSGEPLAAMAALIERQPVPYGALVSLGDPVVLSRSPELFFQVDADGWIETRPMKGTAPRGRTRAADEELKSRLENDPKNRAENRMIVDLLRNDISRITQVGTLSVPALFEVESYRTVHQMVSTIRARLLPDLTIRDLFAALFPCGSITGAPKIRAMEILRELEPLPRDVYCGAIGWIAPGGPMRFNVAIRTLSLYPGGEAVYNVGGGIVFDSTAKEEYAECLLKARFATGTQPVSN